MTITVQQQHQSPFSVLLSPIIVSPEPSSVPSTPSQTGSFGNFTGNPTSVPFPSFNFPSSPAPQSHVSSSAPTYTSHQFPRLNSEGYSLLGRYESVEQRHAQYVTAKHKQQLLLQQAPPVTSFAFPPAPSVIPPSSSTRSSRGTGVNVDGDDAYESVSEGEDSNEEEEEEEQQEEQEDEYKVVDPLASNMLVYLNGLQICWTYRELARLQMFFTEDEIPKDFLDEKVTKFLSEFSLISSAQTSTFNWAIKMFQCELLVVESTATPECFPMLLEQASFSRNCTQSVPPKIRYRFEGDVAFQTFMWNKQTKKLARHTLTSPFTLAADYIVSPIVLPTDQVIISVSDPSHKSVRPPDQYVSALSLKAKNLSIQMSHFVYIMMLNSLDHQLQTMRDVAEMRDKAKPKVAIVRTFFEDILPNDFLARWNSTVHFPNDARQPPNHFARY